eukprot:TRINITY_DN5871_c0_g1_i4.p1 TRINITY_DN5871_c0_g1~~TRINITY_DN5871_c0_g1_i4.p1  ORF type:complete len:619 (-),score=136.21 TRINITY_DN5871_c0_g1_i4:698-2554(-)
MTEGQGMELIVLESSGLPEEGVLSVRSGQARRQQPLPCSAAFQLPAGPTPVLMEALAWAGWSEPEVTLAGSLRQDGLYQVPLGNPQNRPMSVTFRVGPQEERRGAKEDEASSEEAQGSASRFRRKVQKEASIDAYLKKHHLQEFMREIFHRITKEQPEDPYAYIGRCLREAAEQELPPTEAPDAPPPPPVEAFRRDGEAEDEVISSSKAAPPPSLKSALAPKAGADDRRRSETRRVRLSDSASEPAPVLPSAPPPNRLEKEEAVSKSIFSDLADEAFDRVNWLRKQAAATLSRSHSDGRLHAALAKQQREPQVDDTDASLNRVLQLRDEAREAVGQVSDAERKAALRQKAKETLSRSLRDGRLSEAFARCPVTELRRRARETLSSGYSDGRLDPAVSRIQLRAQSDNTDERAEQAHQLHPGADDGRFDSETESERAMRLRKQARYALSGALGDGRLAAALARCQEVPGEDGIDTTDVSADRMMQLRSQARAAVSKGARDGQLAALLSKCQRLQAEDTTDTTDDSSSDRMLLLRNTARDALSKGSRNGKLAAALSSCRPVQGEASRELPVDASSRVLSLRDAARDACPVAGLCKERPVASCRSMPPLEFCRCATKPAML